MATTNNSTAFIQTLRWKMDNALSRARFPTLYSMNLSISMNNNQSHCLKWQYCTPCYKSFQCSVAYAVSLYNCFHRLNSFPFSLYLFICGMMAGVEDGVSTVITNHLLYHWAMLPCLLSLISFNFYFYLFLFETESYYITQDSFELPTWPRLGLNS